MYACHAPMDTSLRVGTAAAIVEALHGTVVGHFWPYGDGHAGLVADIPPISSSGLVRRAREIFGVDTVEVEGAVHDTVTRVGVVGGIGDHVEQSTLPASTWSSRRSWPAGSPKTSGSAFAPFGNRAGGVDGRASAAHRYYRS